MAALVSVAPADPVWAASVLPCPVLADSVLTESVLSGSGPAGPVLTGSVPADFAAADSAGHSPVRHEGITQFVQSLLTTKNGLPQNSVHSIAQTRDGYMWFGTEEGLVRFDGVHATVFDTIHFKALGDNYIGVLAAARDGSLWVGSRTGLLHFHDGVFQAYLKAKSPISTILEAANGVVWVGTMDGLYSVDGEQIRRYTTQDGLPGNAVNAIAQGTDQTVWLGTDKGVASWKDGAFHAYGVRDGFPSGNVLALAASLDGSLWIATSKGLLKWNGRRIVAIPAVAMPSYANITSLLEDSGGTLWIGFSHNGIGSLRNGVFTAYTARQGLPSDDVSRIFQDRDGHFWVGLLDGGAVELRHGIFSSFGKPEGLSEDMVWSALEARDGSLWVGTNNRGLNHLELDGKVRVYGPKDGLPGGSAFALAESPDGSLWIGSEHGKLSRFRNGRITAVPVPEQKADINSILYDRNGDLWIAFHQTSGLMRMHGGHFQQFTVPGLANTFAIDRDGSVWVATDHGGVNHIQLNGQITSYTTENGLLSNFAQSVYIDKEDVVWVGTSPGGLNRIENGRITTYTPDQGLFDLTVGTIIEDDEGYLWMSSDRGIWKVRKSELNDYAAGRVHAIHSIVYGAADGLRSTECNFGPSSSVWKSRDGRLWFATTGGIASVDPAHSEITTGRPSLLIEQVLVNQKPVPFESGVTAGPGGGDLEIRFTAPDFVAPGRIRFRYRLEGFDTKWVDAGERREAIYTKLPPGSYRFELQGTNGDEDWSASALGMAVRLTPHFWQTEWFLALCVLLLLLLIAFLFWLRVRLLVSSNRELEEKVSRRTEQLQDAIRITEAARKALEEQAARDGLTQLWNRGTIFEMLHMELVRALRKKQPVTVLMMDVDNFKSINDTRGHLVGDKVLRALARCIEEHVRQYDFTGRYGGEEFVIVLPGCSLEDGVMRAEEFRLAIAEMKITDGAVTFGVTCSFGVACCDGEMDSEEMIRRADEALYEAKRAGRNCVRGCDEEQRSLAVSS
jgi:diguanylate cyclase (GGDEF)-like protein